LVQINNPYQKNFMLKKLWLLLLFHLIALPASAQTVSMSSLLDEMNDRDALTRFPHPAYHCTQASSYDRASKSPNEPGWFANGDASQFIREEVSGNRKEWVLMDAEGPGAIVRWWITAPHYKVTFRLYLDGSDTPAIEAPIGDLIGGTFLAGYPLSAARANGRNLYLPIPYAKHCKVTVDSMDVQGNLYYQINYRTYPVGTNVESFTMNGFKSLGEKIDVVQKSLIHREIPQDLGQKLVVPKGGKPLLLFEQTTEGQRRGLGNRRAQTQSGLALQQIALRFSPSDVELAQALRSTVLSIKFDGKVTVWCPLGDFFGSGDGLNPYRSRYAWIEREGTMVSLWYMPFRESVEVSLINYGEKDVKIIDNQFSTVPYQWDDRSMYFHADWRQDREIETVAGDGTKDWNYIKLKGRGVFVGDVLSVLNRVAGWWGEGDEKIYVDGETFPSHFGTGTEDYYGYAWCTPEFFDSPFHFQPRAEGPGNYGHTTNGRVRLLDGIPFTKDFRFDMEVWHWEKTKIDYAVATFWYGFADTVPVDFQKRADQITEVKSPVVYTTPMLLAIPGFQIEKAPTGGRIQNQGMQGWAREGRKWDNDDQLWWTGAKPGDKLELILETDKEGTYKLVGELTKARDYGIVQFRVDDKNVGEPIDLYNPEVIPTGAIEIGSIALKAGKHMVEIEIVGKNDSADPSYMVGIDKLLLVQ